MAAKFEILSLTAGSNIGTIRERYQASRGCINSATRDEHGDLTRRSGLGRPYEPFVKLPGRLPHHCQESHLEGSLNVDKCNYAYIGRPDLHHTKLGLTASNPYLPF